MSNPETTSLSTPDPVYRLMESSHEALNAIDEVIAAANHEIRIFDVSSQSLRGRDFGTPARIEALKKMLLAKRHNLLRIALHETTGIEAELARLVALKLIFPRQILIHRTLGVAREAKDVMIIADETHVWRKPYFEHPRSVLHLHQAEATQPFLDRFAQIWDSTEVATVGGATGL